MASLEKVDKLRKLEKGTQAHNDRFEEVGCRVLFKDLIRFLNVKQSRYHFVIQTLKMASEKVATYHPEKISSRN